MTLRQTVTFDRRRNGGRYLAAAVLGGCSIAYFLFMPGIQYLSGDVAIGLAWAILGASSIHQAICRLPKLYLDEEGIELYHSVSRRERWAWRHTSQFQLSPPAHVRSNHRHLVALFPGRVAGFKRVYGHSRPDFTQADIVIDVNGYLAPDDPEAAEKFLEQVNQARERSLAALPVDPNYVGDIRRARDAHSTPMIGPA